MQLTGAYKAVLTFNTPDSPITVTFLAQNGITIDFNAEVQPIVVDGLGAIDQFNSGTTAKISWAHDGYFDSALVSYLNSFASMLPGKNLLADSTLVLTSMLSSRSIYTFRNVAPEGLPSLKQSSQGVMNGSFSFIAACKSDMLPSSAESLFAITTGGGAASIPARDPSGYITGVPTLNFSADTESPLYAFYAREGLNWSFNMQASQIRNEHQGLSAMLFQNVSLQADFIPDGGTLTEANVLDLLAIQASTGAMGARRGSTQVFSALQPTTGLYIEIPRPVVTMNKHVAASNKLLQDGVTFKSSRGANTGGAIAAAYDIGFND